MLVAGFILGVLAICIIAYGINHPEKLPWNKD
jgi:hypothetical protein